MKLKSVFLAAGAAGFLSQSGLGAAGGLPAAVSPEAEGVSSAGIMKWIDACERELDAMHGFVLLRHGKVIAEGSWAPYDTLNETHRLYSHSKAFTSTAVGFLVDDGKVDLDERVIDILPDKAPAEPSENHKALRVRDLLTMNVGRKHTDAERDDPDGDWEKAMLGATIDGHPGQAFRYDSGATYLLAAIVERKSGQPMMDFLKTRLFDRLGITSVWTTTSPSGTPCGGWGMNTTTRELALFGQLYLQKGVWNGSRLLSEDWVALATSRQTWSGPIGVTGEDGSDWHCGYGFKFWRCRHGCYRADGANGQYSIVFPEQDAVLSIHAGLSDMQKELDVVWDNLLPAFAKDALPEDGAAAKALKARCAKLALPPVAGVRDGAETVCGRDLAMDKVACHIRNVRIDRASDGWTVGLKTEVGSFSVPAGFGVWKRGQVTFSDKRHETLGDIVGEQRLAGSAAVQADGALKVRLWMLDGPQKIDLRLFATNGVVTVDGRLHGLGGGPLSGCEVQH